MTRNVLTLCLCLCLSPGMAAAGAKTDIVLLKNGDRVTGEVIRQEAGLLEFNTDTMGRVFIEWRFISEIISDKSHSVETVDGARWLGRLEKPGASDHIVVNTVRGPIDLDPEEVVSVWPVEATFWDKLDLDTSVGFDYAKATDIANFNVSVDLLHVSTNRLTEASLRTDVTSQSSGEDQRRNEIRFAHQYLLPELKFRTFFAALESNDALGIDLRTSGGGGVGKYLVKTNRQWLTVTGGLLGTNEQPAEGQAESNIEAVVAMGYRYFRFAEPERSLDARLSVFPSLTDSGRVRSDLRSTFKLEFFKDLFWALEIYATHDSDPVSIAAEKTDYGIVTSLGWSN